MQVRDWYVESFKELRNFKPIRDAESELKFTGLLRHIYHRHRYEQKGSLYTIRIQPARKSLSGSQGMLSFYQSVSVGVFVRGAIHRRTSIGSMELC